MPEIRSAAPGTTTDALLVLADLASGASGRGEIEPHPSAGRRVDGYTGLAYA